MERISIGEVATVRSGFAFKSRDWLDAGVSVIKIGNVKAGWVTLDGCSFVSEEVAKEATAFELCPGDVLISMTGHIGEVARVRSERRMLLNQRVGRFIVRDAARLNLEFLYYCLQEPELKASMAAHRLWRCSAEHQPVFDRAAKRSRSLHFPSSGESRASCRPTTS